jgi:hypothetical protein
MEESDVEYVREVSEILLAVLKAGFADGRFMWSG